MPVPDFFVPTTLQTPRLLLRPMVEADAPALFAIHSDHETMRYWSTPPWTDPAEGLRMIDRDRQGLRDGASIRLGLELRERHDAPKIIGTCTLYNFQHVNRRAEIGYSLHRAKWGRGLMHEALTALLSHGFENRVLHRVEADIDPRNLASARSLERLGFLREGHLRERWIVNGEISDTALYGLLKRDWDTRDASR
ncbi:MAG: GNAT family N-acetyltransferase [Burkholderiaceae bacterium]